jgi:hypothetical protein
VLVTIAIIVGLWCVVLLFALTLCFVAGTADRAGEQSLHAHVHPLDDVIPKS